MKFFYRNNKFKNPDYKFEKFWLNIKISMNSFYCTYLKYPNRVNHWSSILNDFQTQNNFYEIIRHIELFLCYFSLNVMNSLDTHFFTILYNNYKLWNKIKKQEEKLINNFNFSIDNNTTFFSIELFNSCIHHINTKNNFDIIYKFFYNIENFNFNNLRTIFYMAVVLNNHSILLHLSKYVDLNTVCKEYFNLDISNKIKPKKLLEILTFTNIYNI
jgi:hypothetical protein